MTRSPDDQATRREALADWITRSGLTVRAFARLTLRDDRTVRRWLQGATPIPNAIARWLETENPEGYQPVSEPPTEG